MPGRLKTKSLALLALLAAAALALSPYDIYDSHTPPAGMFDNVPLMSAPPAGPASPEALARRAGRLAGRDLPDEYNWRQAGHNNGATGYNPLVAQSDATYLWFKQQTGSNWMPWGGYPIEADAYVVFVDHNPGNITCYDKSDGTQVWQQLCGNQTYRGRVRPPQPAIFEHGGVSYVAALGYQSGAGTFICWRLADGVEMWRTPITLSTSLGAYKARPMYINGSLYFTLHSEAGTARPIYKVDAGTGVATSLTTRAYESWGGMCSDGQYLYVTEGRSGQARIHKYDLNGNEVAVSPSQGTSLLETFPAVYDGKVYVGWSPPAAAPARVVAFNTSDMSVAWSRENLSGGYDSQWITVDEFGGGNVYVAPYAGTACYIYALRQSDGSNAWTPYLVPNTRIYNGGLAVTGDAGNSHRLYFTPGYYGVNGSLLVLNADNGTLIQDLQYAAGEQMFCGTGRTADGVLSKTGYGSLYYWEVEDLMVSQSVAPTAILAPVGVVDSGVVLTPRVVVRNKSEIVADSVHVTFQIDDELDAVIYSDETYLLGMAAGALETLAFTPWVPVGRDSLKAVTWTFWEDDSSPRDDTLRTRFMVRMRNVGITEILAPPSPADSGMYYWPQARVYNYGTQSETFNVNFRIGAFNHNVLVTDLQPNYSRVVTATDSWQARPGRWVHTVSALLAGDLHPEDNVMVDTIEVEGIVEHDVAVEEILVPVGFYDTLTTVTPQARVANYGGGNETFRVWFTVWDTATDVRVYRDSLQVSLPGGGNTVAAFTPVRFTLLGPYVGQCSVYLAWDQNALNDVVNQDFTISSAQHDVALEAILAPAGSIDSGATVIPRVVVRNGGLFTEDFPVWFELPGGYLRSVNVFDLAPGGVDTVSFSPAWRANFRDSLTARAWTRLPGDELPDNDTLEQRFFVQVGDVGVMYVIYPVDTVLEGTWMTPQARVKNYGTKPETFEVDFRIGLFLSTMLVENLGPGAELDLSFPDSLEAIPGIWLDRVETRLPGDINPGNNVAYDTFVVPGLIEHDVGVVAVFEPAANGSYDTTDLIVPSAAVKNFGTTAETWVTYFRVLDASGTEVYADEQLVTLDAGVEDTLEFTVLQLALGGQYTARCSTFLATDQNWTNNLVWHRFEVSDPQLWPGGWVEVAPMPLAPSGRSVRRGGWLAKHEGDGMIYAAKGYKTNDFYRYDPIANAWTELSSPPVDPVKGRPLEKGSRGISDGDNALYVVHGNNTTAFWKYDIEADSWSALANVPEGVSRKRVRGGGDMAYVMLGDVGYVYFLKGDRTEFYRYNTQSGQWETRADAPVGIRNRWMRDSWLTGDVREGPGEDRVLYAHKARYYDRGKMTHELWKYDVASDSWHSGQLAGMPLMGLHGGRIRRKRARDGGSGAKYGQYIYALKGGNTQQFWRYGIEADTWTELDTVPTLGSTGRRRRMNAGSYFVAYGGGAFFALKGNKTVEMWRYVIPYELNRTDGRGGVAGAGKVPVAAVALRLEGNPVAGGVARLRYALPGAGAATVTLYDVTGRSVLQRQL
ncbi:MAG: PQQ-binding-like beta-propeller repeat protein, partial [bacterium]